MHFSFLKSKTVWGAILTAGAWILSQPHIDPVTVVQAIGSIVTVIGARSAIAKNGVGQ